MILRERSGNSNFQPHPETEGTIHGVIVDITPLKTSQTQYGERETFRLVYETEAKNDQGNSCCIWSRPYTESLHEKSAFRKDLKKILGRDLTKAELNEFDTESLIGHGVSLIVQHEAAQNGQTYAVISFIAPDKTKAIKPSGSYKRVKDREQAPAGSGDTGGYRKAPAAAPEESRQDWQKVKVHVGKHAGVDLGDLDEVAVNSLIEKWLPTGQALPKPLKADCDLIAALLEVKALLGSGEEEDEELGF
jgi:hypothetical protein